MEGMENNEVLTPQENLSLLSDKLISSCIKGDDVSVMNRRYLFGQFNVDMFRDENFLIYYVMYRYKDKRITLDSEFVEYYYLNNGHLLDKFKSMIDVSAYANEQLDEKISYIGATIKQFVRLSKLPTLSTEEFKLTIEKYRLLMLAIESSKIYTTAELIAMDSYTEGRRKYAGFEDSKAYVKKEFARLDNISTQDSGEGFISLRGRTEEDDSDRKPVQVSSWGIEELDNHFNAIYSGDFISILAPPKAGKTKLTTQLVHRTVVEHGNPVVVWAVEGGRIAWEAQIRAKHFDYIYNNNIVDVRMKKVGVDVDTIKKDSFSTPELRQLEQASKLDLYNNPNYGEIVCIDRPFLLETFIDELDTAVQLNNAKLVAIDYLQLIGSNSGKKKNERVGEAYQELLRWAKTRNITIITPAQFTQEFIKEMTKKGTTEGAEVRTGGGESAEIIRTPDINIALWATADDLLNGVMSLLSVPSRNASPFPTIKIGCELGNCNFFSLPDSYK